jgi:hypothetical protein
MKKWVIASMDTVIGRDNIFYQKLVEWYGKHLDAFQVGIVEVSNVEGFIDTVTFVLKEGNKVEMVRVFTLGDTVAISVDLKTNISTVSGVCDLLFYSSIHKTS